MAKRAQAMADASAHRLCGGYARRDLARSFHDHATTFEDALFERCLPVGGIACQEQDR